ncbi:MAG TPA: hypothetical protein VFF73_16370, partial [Planctomycetota bacterium]|nr:hypothetical protein [Planctomycetota bacterium]
MLLASPALRCAAAALATAIAVSGLAHAGRLWGSGRWATTSALVLGCEDATRGDLRFAAFVAALAAAIAWIVALDRPLHDLSQTGRAFVLVVGLPVMALFVAGLADILRGEAPSPREAGGGLGWG